MPTLDRLTNGVTPAPRDLAFDGCRWQRYKQTHRLTLW